MRALSRGGFLLVELLIGMTMFGIVIAMLVTIVRGTARTTARASQLLVADRALLSLQGLAQQELRDARRSDVSILSPTRLGLSRPIGEAVVCADSGGIVLFADQAWTGTRAPEAGRDDAWLLLDPVLEQWQQVPIDSAGRGRCPLDGAPATRLVMSPHAAAAMALRVMEPVELSAYPSGVADWFGLTPASHSAVVQPFAGPLVAAATRFTAFPDHLELVVPPRAVTATTVQIPLGPP